ncbi:MAG: EAL domain-containing protein [Sulfurimicrobium sp.]|nr:EAL domain-containing protein [Sulfurimicrobium sp.]
MIAFLGMVWAASAQAVPREVRVGIYSNEPKIFLDQDGRPTGILGDVLAEIAKREAWTLQPVQCDWQACLKELKAGRIDLLPDLAYSEERAKEFDFHQTPVLHSWSAIYRKEGKPINTMPELQGMRVAVLADSIQEGYLRELLAGFGVRAQLMPVQSLEEGFEKVAADEADAAVANRFFGDLKAPSYKLVSSPIMFQPTRLFYGARQGSNADLLQAIDRHLGAWLAQPDSPYYKVLERWMGSPPHTVLPSWIVRGVGALAALLLVALLISAYLRRLVVEKTRHLQESKDQLRLFIEHAPAALAMFDREMRYLAVSRRWRTDYSLGECDIIGHSHYEIFPEIPEAWKVLHRRALAGEIVQSDEDCFERKDGSAQWLRWELIPWHLASGAPGGIIIFTEDITVLKEHQLQLEHIAHYDILTGLPNRVLLADRLHQAMAQTQRRGDKLAVAYLDLDGFKAINDRHGHDVGDQLLKTVAARMKQVLREGDTLARLGGDEFVAVLNDLADAEASVPMLTRLLDAVAEPIQAGSLAPQVSASLGVTFYPQMEEADADQLLRQADQAMYQAKLAGKNRYHVFDAEQDRSVRGHHESLERIKRALIAREFVLYYQPKVNMRTGAVIGAEALIRWQHPEKGLLPPGVFLPVIEDHPLAVEIGEWVIDTALAQMETWRGVGLDIPVSVNVCARHLQQADFVERLHCLLAAYPELKPSSLELEVLETSALQDIALVSRVISACREIGVRFALDDFGTGYASLTYLKHLPAEVLKIDQSFIHGMLDDPEDLAILVGVLGLANAFRRQPIAEGVETLAHGEMLLQLGCELAQGYGISRPMPASAMPEWAAAWRPEPRWVAATALHPDKLPMIYAGVEHRAWIVTIEAALRGDCHAQPLDVHHCRFGAWLDVERQTGRSGQQHFQSIDALHRQVHALADELLEHRSQGQTSLALERLGELYNLRDMLLEQLQALIAPG